MWFRSLFQGASTPVCVQGHSQESPRPPGLSRRSPRLLSTVGARSLLDRELRGLGAMSVLLTTVPAQRGCACTQLAEVLGE